MSKLTISNLEDGRDLDPRAEEEVRGGVQVPGLGELPGVSNLLASINSVSIAQNPVNIVMGGSGGDGDTANYLGSATVTPLNISSPVTVVQGGLPTA